MILVVGSVALDNITSPAGQRTRTLGGACTYFATAASLYAQVSVVGVIGTDFPQEHVDFLASRRIDVRGLQRVAGRTFAWSGRYGDDLGDAQTLDTQLNVFADFHPVIPDDLRQAEYVFLANIDPDLQLEVLDQVCRPRLVALDSMNYWMATKRDALVRALARVDLVVLNEAEVRLFSGESNILVAAQRLLAVGPQALVIKRGEHGAMLVTRSPEAAERYFAVPAYPVERVVDPTGAGDTFAAGLMGYLARTGDLSLLALRRAVVHGTLVASFTVQDFSIDRLRTLTLDEIEERYRAFRTMTHFDGLDETECAALQAPAIF
ncbi:MAG: PfkB family carbohydrate kinase [Chloroflexota bacterium]